MKERQKAPRIISNPRIMLGKPVVSGTRITVQHIIELLDGGMTVDEMLYEHPSLTRADIQAAVTFYRENS